MTDAKFRKFGGKRYELAETGHRPGELDPLRDNYMRYGYYVRVVGSNTHGSLLYVRKKRVAKQKPNDVKMTGALYTYRSGIKYRREAAYRAKRSATKEAERIRSTGCSARIIAIPTGWGVYKEYTKRGE